VWARAEVEVGLAIRTLAALAVIFGTLYAVQVVLRRAGRWRVPGGSNGLRLVESLFLPEGASLHVVEFVGHRYLIGRAAGAVSLLCDVPITAHDLG
jgi:flagellar biogenesis protein FliO